MKSYLKSKTMWAAFAVTVLGAFQVMAEGAPLDPQIQGGIVAGIGVVMAFLRSITTEPVG